MIELYDIYGEFPFRELLESKALKRIDKVGMNCGLEYTSFPLFKGIQLYSRLQHSIGVACIIYHFTKDKKQSLSGLFHDIATPVFAHVVDFLNHDYLKQESTEDHTSRIIQDDSMIMNYLQQHQIQLEEVENYHLYPIADNDSPKLSSDRLEYTIGNAINYNFAKKEDIKEIYDDLVIGINEENEKEIMFTSLDKALKFGRLSLKCSKVYVADNDRYCMEYLARLLKEAIECNLLKYNDLYTTEDIVIQKMIQDPTFKENWEYYQRLNKMIISKNKIEDSYKINAKKRYIDPYIQGIGRLSQTNIDYLLEINAFSQLDFDYYIKGMVE